MSAFGEALRKRGVVVKRDGQEAVGLNKMSVKICFLKRVTPIYGELCLCSEKG